MTTWNITTFLIVTATAIAVTINLQLGLFSGFLLGIAAGVFWIVAFYERKN